MHVQNHTLQQTLPKVIPCCLQECASEKHNVHIIGLSAPSTNIFELGVIVSSAESQSVSQQHGLAFEEAESAQMLKHGDYAIVPYQDSITCT